MTKRRTVWLIDASTYHRSLSPELAASKNQFFRLETCARERRFGRHAVRGMRSFSSGLLEIANLLVESGHDVRYLTLDEASSAIEVAHGRPDVVGFGAVTPTVPACSALAEEIRRRYPATRLVLGGPHAAAAGRLTRSRFPVWDAIVSGRGVDAARALADVDARASRAPCYELLAHPLQEYGLNLMTAEGCVFSCAYCHDGTIPHRDMSLDGGLARLASRIPAKTPVHFCDSVLGRTAPRLRAVCDALSQIDHRALLSCDLRAEFLTPDVVPALVGAGFVEIRIGLESADPDVLRTVRRTCVPDEVIRRLSMVREQSNLYVSVYFVSGLPGYDRSSGEADRETIATLFRSGLVDQIKHHLYVPYPQDDCPTGHRDIRLTTDDWSLFDRNSYPTFELPSISAEDLWMEFLDTERTINREWRSALRLDTQPIDEIPLYGDYNVRVYLHSAGAPPQPIPGNP